MRLRPALLPLACTLALMPRIGEAGNPLASAWQCTKSAGGASLAVSQDALAKAETVASLGDQVPACLGNASADQIGFGITMGAITAIKIASPETLPDGQCQTSVQNLVARPFAQGIHAVMPPIGAKDKLGALLQSDAAGELLWQQFKVLPPPVMNYVGHVECACTLIDKSVTLTDLSTFSNAVRSTSQDCGRFLDDAGLGFINDFGNAGIAWTGQRYSDATGWWDRNLLGQANAAPDDTVYQMFWAPYLVEQANRILDGQGQGYRWNRTSAVIPDEVKNAGGGAFAANQACQSGAKPCHTSLPEVYAQCVTYYDEHTLSPENARERCDALRDQRFGPEAVQLATRFNADIATRKAVDAALSQARSAFVQNTLWRLPRRPGDSPGPGGNAWPAQEAQNRVLGGIGQALPAGASSRGPWDYVQTGVYAAARNALPGVGWQPEAAAKQALAGLSAHIDAELREAWGEWDHHDATSRLAEWLPTPAFGGTYGCPGDNSAGLASACRAAVLEAYGKVCETPVREAHLRQPNVLALGVKMGEVKANCLSWLAPIIARANALSQAVDPALQVSARLCGGLQERSEDRQRCERRVQDEWAGCRLEALKAGKAVEDAQACLERYAIQTGVRAGQGLRVGPSVAPAAPVQAPSAPSAPATPSAPVRALRLVSPPPPAETPSAQAGEAPSRPSRPTSADAPAAAPTPAASGPVLAPNALRLVPRGGGRPACPEGEVLQRDGEGRERCVPEGRGDGR